MRGMREGMSGGTFCYGDILFAGMHPVWTMCQCVSGEMPAFWADADWGERRGKA